MPHRLSVPQRALPLDLLSSYLLTACPSRPCVLGAVCVIDGAETRLPRAGAGRWANTCRISEYDFENEPNIQYSGNILRNSVTAIDWDIIQKIEMLSTSLVGKQMSINLN